MMSQLEEDATQEKYLRDYYDQLPTETASFSPTDYPLEVPKRQNSVFVTDLISPLQDDVSSPGKQLHVAASDPLVIGSIPGHHAALLDNSNSEDVPLEGAPVEEVGDVSPPNVTPRKLPMVEDKELPVSNDVMNMPESLPFPENWSEECGFIPVGGAVTVWKERIVDLMFWRDVRWSGAVFFFSLLILISMRCFSFISVVSYSALALLSVTMAFRIYKFVLQTINGTQQPNPFQTLLDADLTISQKQWQCYADATLVHVNNLITCTRGLLLISSVTSSIKFGLLMWLMTYVGEWFDLLTLLTIDLVFAFTLPPIYEKYQQPIDAYYGMAISKVREVIILVKSKIPGPKQKKQ